MLKRKSSTPSDGHALLDSLQAVIAEHESAATARQSVVREEIARLQAESSSLTEVQAIAARINS